MPPQESRPAALLRDFVLIAQFAMVATDSPLHQIEAVTGFKERAA
jgi:hypothetical protein